MSLWEERAARNESLFREVNEQVATVALRAPDPQRLGFVCECADAQCIERLTVPLDVYEQVRADPRHFIVAPGHENHDLERVIAHSDGYTVIEKDGIAGRVATRLDPRE